MVLGHNYVKSKYPNELLKNMQYFELINYVKDCGVNLKEFPCYFLMTVKYCVRLTYLEYISVVKSLLNLANSIVVIVLLSLSKPLSLISEVVFESSEGSSLLCDLK